MLLKNATLLANNKEETSEDRWKNVPKYEFGTTMKTLDEEIKEETNDSEKILEDAAIDYKLGIENFGSTEMYKQMLQDWYNEVTEKWDRIVSNKENMKEYSIDVHSLKSDSKYFGFYFGYYVVEVSVLQVKVIPNETKVSFRNGR